MRFLWNWISDDCKVFIKAAICLYLIFLAMEVFSPGPMTYSYDGYSELEASE